MELVKSTYNLKHTFYSLHFPFATHVHVHVDCGLWIVDLDGTRKLLQVFLILSLSLLLLLLLVTNYQEN